MSTRTNRSLSIHWAGPAALVALALASPACEGDLGDNGTGTTGAGASSTGASGNSGGTGNSSTGGTGNAGGSAGGSGGIPASGGAGGAGNQGGIGAQGGGGSGGNGGVGAATVDCTAPQGAEPSIALTQVVTGLDSPLLLKSAPGDDRWYVLQQTGEILLVDGGQTSTFLDIDAKVLTSGERGLLGFAFHPDYAQNGRFFVHYTPNAGGTVIEEYQRSTLDPDVADPDPVGAPIFTAAQPDTNHNGGSIEFSPVDGYLYIFLGDGGGGGDPFDNGQDTTSPLGKVLRIDVDGAVPYAIPPGNLPGGLAEIWDFGLRNPYRTSFDACTGDLYIADVGQNALEEVNVEPAGMGHRNYGWNIMEGDECYNAASCNMAGLTLPVTQYSHALGCSVTGGYVYRGTNVPALRGRYFYGDFCSGRIWSFRYQGGVAVDEKLEIDTNLSISGFGQDNAGEVYVVNLSGTILRIDAM